MSVKTKGIRSERLEEPLLAEKNESEDGLIPTCEAFYKVSNIAKNVVIGMLFYSLYNIVNVLVLGHEDSPEPLAGLGLGSLTVGILGLTVGASF